MALHKREEIFEIFLDFNLLINVVLFNKLPLKNIDYNVIRISKCFENAVHREKNIFLRYMFIYRFFNFNFGIIFYIFKRSCVFILLRNVKREIKNRFMLMNKQIYVLVKEIY